MATYVLGDIHGAYKALIQCLERSNFNYEEDTLIQLGDVADGWDEVYECVEELLKIKNLIAIKGNHDDWFNDFLLYGKQGVQWQQGGIGTLKSYCKYTDKNYYGTHAGYITDMLDTDISVNHHNFFRNQKLYHIDDQNRMFVHGGFNRHHLIIDIEKQEPSQFYWDRDLWMSALSHKEIKREFKIKDNFKEIFIGHTTTMNWNTDKPIKAVNIWNLDTGAGFKGKLTIMNVDTKEYFQSDGVTTLYTNQKGRN